MWGKRAVESPAIRGNAASRRENRTRVNFNDGGESDHLQATEGMLVGVAMSVPFWAVGLLAGIWWLG